jgi:hypothetical protein
MSFFDHKFKRTKKAARNSYRQSHDRRRAEGEIMSDEFIEADAYTGKELQRIYDGKCPKCTAQLEKAASMDNDGRYKEWMYCERCGWDQRSE